MNWWQVLRFAIWAVSLKFAVPDDIVTMITTIITERITPGMKIVKIGTVKFFVVCLVGFFL
jgi:hypothetical protein